MGVREIRYCDISGTEPAEPHEIIVDQMHIQIDLAATEYQRLLALLEPYLEAGSVEAATHAVRPARRTGAGLSPEERTALKEWAARAGVELPPNGRIKRVIIERWRAEGDQPAAASAGD